MRNREEYNSMLSKLEVPKIINIGLILIIGLIAISERSCVNRNKTVKSGSSSIPSTFIINAPSRLSATVISYSQINLTWLDNSNNEDGFEIERSTDGVNYTVLATVNANTPYYYDMGPFSLVNYYYRVRAYNSIGDYSDYSNVTIVGIEVTGWSVIAAGQAHSLALAGDSTLWGWGDNQYGQLNPADPNSSLASPTLLSSELDWSRIGAGYYHTLVIKNNRTLWAWGNNDYGQLGVGNTDYPAAFTLVNTDSDWSIVTAGEYHSIGLKTNLTIWSWGINRWYVEYRFEWESCGQLGLGDSIDRYTPTQIGTTSDWSSISCGGRHTIAIKTNKTLWGWGWNYNSQLESGSTNRTTPRQIGNNPEWMVVSANYDQSYAVKTNGTLLGWGWLVPNLGADTDWLMVSAGGSDYNTAPFVLAMKQNRTLWSRGYNTYGQLGLGDYSSRTAPVQITYPSEPWSMFVTGGQHAIGQTTNGEIWVWGGNTFSQLGLGTEYSGTPNIPINLTRFQPANLFATCITWTQIALSWTDSSFGETGFIIERSALSTTDYSVLATVDQNIISYSDSSITRGNTYYYRVKASYPGGDSSYSNVAVCFSYVWEMKVDQVVPRSEHSMVWDQAGSRVIVFGGKSATGNKNDVWWYYPVTNTWIQKFTSSTPTARTGHSMVWDSAGSKVIMFGGKDTVNRNDLWWYYPVTNTWIQKFTSSTPTARSYHFMVWDEAGARAIMFGGFDSVIRDDLWWYYPVTNTWIPQYTAITPSARMRHSIVWDQAGSKVIMFSGSDASGRVNDLWWYDPASGTNGAWIQMIANAASGSPSGRINHAMVWDTTRSKVIMFSGNDLTGIKNDLWVYDPIENTWSQKILNGSPNVPVARMYHSMIWNPIEQRMIMFGGLAAGSVIQSDLWWWW